MHTNVKMNMTDKNQEIFPQQLSVAIMPLEGKLVGPLEDSRKHLVSIACHV